MPVTSVTGHYLASPPALLDGQESELLVDANGLLKVTATFSPSGTQDTNLTQVAGSSVTAGAGAVAAGTLRITQASDSPEISALGAQADAAWASGSGSIIAILKGIFGRFASFFPASLGSKANSASLSVAPSGLEYETVAASQTDQVLGATGATGDYLSHIVIQPAAVGAGTVTVKDNTTVIFTFTTGTLSDLSPKTVPFGAFSVSGAWKVTTGASVAVIGFGDFT